MRPAAASTLSASPLPMREATRALTDQAFERSAGAALITGNGVRLLKNAAENYPAWLQAIGAAQVRIHFENYIFADDVTGNQFADALIERARAGVTVRLIYDWLGVFGKASRALWARLCAGGVEVRCFNPPRLESPLGWVSRDHRKLIVVDGEVGFVAGLCVADLWLGKPERAIEPWRDTGVEIRGPAVAELERAFGRTWGMLGVRLPEAELATDTETAAGDVSLRIVATEPTTSGTFRLDQLLVALARKRVWITDAYYLGAPTYVQALMASARDGVDVRMLFTRSSDIPLLKLMSQTGYRTLLQAGVRIFEWNGSLLHAKTAVFDGRWSRVGSTNLNFSSWLANCELDAVIEDEGFAQQMEAMYEDDLAHATEVVLGPRRRVQRHPNSAPARRETRGSATRAAAGAMRIGHVLGAALTNRRVFESVETQLLLWSGLGLLVLATLFIAFPRVLAYPAGVILAWLALAVLYRALQLRRKKQN